MIIRQTQWNNEIEERSFQRQGMFMHYVDVEHLDDDGQPHEDDFLPNAFLESHTDK